MSAAAITTSPSAYPVKSLVPSLMGASSFLGLNHPHGSFGAPCPWAVGTSWFPSVPPPIMASMLPPPSAISLFPEYARTQRRIVDEIADLKHSSRNIYNDYLNFVATDMAQVEFRPSSLLEYYSLACPIRVDPRDGSRMLCLCFDLVGYKPHEVSVTFKKPERALIIEAGLEATAGKEHQVARKYYRKYILPEGEDYSSVMIKCNMTPESLLCVDAVLPSIDTTKSSSSSKVRSPTTATTTAGAYIPIEIKAMPLVK